MFELIHASLVKQVSEKASDVVATVSARVRVCGEGGGAIIQTEKNQPAHEILVLIAFMHTICKRPCEA